MGSIKTVNVPHIVRVTVLGLVGIEHEAASTRQPTLSGRRSKSDGCESSPPLGRDRAMVQFSSRGQLQDSTPPSDQLQEDPVSMYAKPNKDRSKMSRLRRNYVAKWSPPANLVFTTDLRLTEKRGSNRNRNGSGGDDEHTRELQPISYDISIGILQQEQNGQNPRSPSSAGSLGAGGDECVHHCIGTGTLVVYGHETSSRVSIPITSLMRQSSDMDDASHGSKGSNSASARKILGAASLLSKSNKKKKKKCKTEGGRPPRGLGGKSYSSGSCEHDDDGEEEMYSGNAFSEAPYRLSGDSTARLDVMVDVCELSAGGAGMAGEDVSRAQNESDRNTAEPIRRRSMKARSDDSTDGSCDSFLETDYKGSDSVTPERTENPTKRNGSPGGQAADFIDEVYDFFLERFGCRVPQAAGCYRVEQKPPWAFQTQNSFQSVSIPDEEDDLVGDFGETERRYSSSSTASGSSSATEKWGSSPTSVAAISRVEQQQLDQQKSARKPMYDKPRDRPHDGQGSMDDYHDYHRTELQAQVPATPIHSNRQHTRGRLQPIKTHSPTGRMSSAALAPISEERVHAQKYATPKNNVSYVTRDGKVISPSDDNIRKGFC